ncbi:peptidylprolyl isomerase [Xanthobacter sp. KR7-65]|uniref:peptidylprolyl isomerase n=1 Tax=Xanthobacter sp. KR7-65 TaxID=3156612 RepID=UPI0032B3AB11
MRIRTILSSPLLHFFVLGGLIFAIYAIMNPRDADGPDSDTLILSETGARGLVADFTATWKRPPTPAELETLMRDWAVEEALVREALVLGLDRGDAIVRNRLRQKALFLAEAPAAAMTPDDATLEAFYRENAARFARPGILSFEQVLLPDEAPQGAIEALRAQLENGADPAELGRATLLPFRTDLLPEPAVERLFGGGFGAAVAMLPPGRWSGPIQSGYGRHLVRLDASRAPELPAFAAMRDKVLTEWRIEQARQLRDAYSRALLARFRTTLPATPQVLGP